VSGKLGDQWPLFHQKPDFLHGVTPFVVDERRTPFMGLSHPPNLLPALLWFNNAFTPRRPMKYRAPSWSWASVEGKVSYDIERIENRSPVESTAEQLNWGEFLLHKVIEDSQGESPDKPYSACHMLLTCRLRTAIWDDSLPRSNTFTSYHGNIQRKALRSSEGTVVGAILPDVTRELVNGQTVHCLSFRDEHDLSIDGMQFELYGQQYSAREGYEADPLVIGLAAVRIEGEEDTYRRIGLLRSVKKSWFAEGHVRNIRMV
jgi:hypothetical protein